MTLLKGFTANVADVNGQTIAYATAGSGPPLLLLHGFPQTHAMWHGIAPELAKTHTVVAADLRGYGASSKPEGTQNYTFRQMAADQLALMEHLGHSKFHLIGHDRGARTAHRLALDAADAVLSLTLMDIVPTHLLLHDLNRHVAKGYYHWFFLAQPSPLPETMIGHDADAFFNACLMGWGATSAREFDPDALNAYRRAWRDPDTIRGMCEDYRAALELDFNLDAGDLDRRLGMPSLILYGADGPMAQAYDVPATWRARLGRMQSAGIPGGHFFPDSAPAETLRVLQGFLEKL